MFDDDDLGTAKTEKDFLILVTSTGQEFVNVIKDGPLLEDYCRWDDDEQFSVVTVSGITAAKMNLVPGSADARQQDNR